jgi:hypothetical protein
MFRVIQQKSLSFFMAIFTIFSVIGTAQEMIRDGNFEDEIEWLIYDMGSNDPSTVEFNYTDEVPAYGDGGCLRIYGGPSDYTNVLVYQELDLIAGTEDVVNAAFKDLTGDSLPEPEGFWCQIYISDEEPVEGVDWKPIAESNSEIYLGFNSWSGCSGSGIDGTFQADACDGKNDTIFVAPGEPGESVLIFIGLKTGVWGTQLSYDVAIDNLSLRVREGSAVAQHEKSVSDFQLHQNYPNPFNAGTTISYSISTSMAERDMTLAIYDLRGQLVKKLVDKKTAAGQHSVHWDGTDDLGQTLTSGTYFARLSAGQFQQTIKLTSLK